MSISVRIFRRLKPSSKKSAKSPETLGCWKTRFVFVSLLLGSLAAFNADVSFRTISSPKQSYLNVVLISLDTVRADSLGIYGNKGGTSPFIDDLAETGTVFVDTLATSPWTLPSHASMFTGLYPSNHGAHCRYGPFTDKVRSLTEILSASGFETVSFNGGANVRGSLGFERGFSIYQSFKFHSKLRNKFEYEQSDPMLPVKNGIDWIKHRALGTRVQGPFFLFLHSFEPHSPYYSRRDDSFSSRDDLMRIQQTHSKTDLEKAHRNYEGGIQWADKYVGKLASALRDTGLAENTIVVLTSDHGESFLEHGLMLHSIKLYPEYVRVPLLIVDPRRPEPIFSSKPASLVDIKPTLLDMLGLPPDPEIDGVSLIRDVDTDRLRFAEVCFDPGYSNRLIQSGIVAIEDVSSKMLAQKNFRLIFNDQKETYELYDVRRDPYAAHNLIDTKMDETSTLPKTLSDWIASTRMGREKPSLAKRPSPTEGQSEEVVDQLKALGYIDSKR